jgi:hypothetical protein
LRLGCRCCHRQYAAGAFVIALVAALVAALVLAIIADVRTASTAPAVVAAAAEPACVCVLTLCTIRLASIIAARVRVRAKALIDS